MSLLIYNLLHSYSALQYKDWYRLKHNSGPNRTKIWKSLPPHQIKMAKGEAHAIMSRAFVDYVINNRVAQDLLKWSADINVPQEFFFPTLQSNPQLHVPGSWTGMCKKISFTYTCTHVYSYYVFFAIPYRGWLSG